MTKRITNRKRVEALMNFLIEKTYEYKKYQYQKVPLKNLQKLHEKTGENIENLKFKKWINDNYNIENINKIQKEHVLEYILQYQINSIRKNQNSYATKHIYRESALEFARYIAIKFKASDYRKIKDKHIESFISAQIEEKMAVGTIQKKLYGIYYYHKILNGCEPLRAINEVIKNV